MFGLFGKKKKQEVANPTVPVQDTPSVETSVPPPETVADPTPITPTAPHQPAVKEGFFARLKRGLSKTSTAKRIKKPR